MLPIFQSAKFELCIYRNNLKTQKECPELASKQNDGDVMSPKSNPHFLYVNNCGEMVSRLCTKGT